MPDVVSQFAENVKKILEERKMSLGALARDSECPTPVISRLLSGQQSIKLETAFKIARALNLSIDELASA